MANNGEAMLVDMLGQISGCGPEIAARAVKLFSDDPTYVGLDEKMGAMLDWVSASSLSNLDSDRKETLFVKIQQLACCGADTARRAVDAFADDPMYVELDEKLAVMLDWVTAYNLSFDVKTEEGTVSPQRHSRQLQIDDARGIKEEDLKEEDETDDLDLNLRWATDAEELERQALEALEEARYGKAEEVSSKKQKTSHSQFGRGRLTGYGVPSTVPVHRQIHESVAGPPFFYFENVYNMPRGEWDSISRYLSAVEPEFTDSKHFTACSRPRGYIHNLPTEGRREVSPQAPRTISELIPDCTDYWPEWDRRTRLNCILTERARESVQTKVRQLVELWTDKSKPPPAYVQKHVLELARRFNLVWVKPGILVPLTVTDIELVMGYDKDHTRALYHPNDRLRRLGDSFQVHTVGYHLSVLKPLYPRGMNVLSLFAGIGGAEVALQKLGVRLNVVVSVESDERSRRVIEMWWKATKQSGQLILRYTDVKALGREALGALLSEVGGFDFIVGGSPCKNLSGLNRVSRTGLAGESSVLFFEFPRILHQVREFHEGLKQETKKNIRL